MRRAVCLLLICAALASANPVPTAARKTGHFLHKVHTTLRVTGEVTLSAIILAAYIYGNARR